MMLHISPLASVPQEGMESRALTTTLRVCTGVRIFLFILFNLLNHFTIVIAITKQRG